MTTFDVAQYQQPFKPDGSSEPNHATMTKILVLYYSAYGHVETMAGAIAEGVREAGVDVVVKRVPELVPEEIASKSGYKLDQAAPIATVNELAVRPATAT